LEKFLKVLISAILCFCVSISFITQIYKKISKTCHIYKKNKNMAKATSKGSNNKVSFGKRKEGQPNGKKSYNKHSPKAKASRGQG
jgi:hypothetical protein